MWLNYTALLYWQIGVNSGPAYIGWCILNIMSQLWHKTAISSASLNVTMLYSFANLAYMTVLSPYEWQVYLITYCTCDALGLWASLHHGKPLLSIAPTRVCQGSRFHRWQYIVVSFISKLTKNNVYNTYSKSKINCNYKLLFFFLNYTFFESSLLFFVTKGWHLWCIFISM